MLVFIEKLKTKKYFNILTFKTFVDWRFASIRLRISTNWPSTQVFSVKNQLAKFSYRISVNLFKTR